MHSSKNIDYTNLESLLAAKNWYAANNETAQKMLEVMETNHHLSVADIQNFPCEDLLKIDQLWVTASHDRFGFSIQKEIYDYLNRSLREKFKQDYEKVWNIFGDRIGWWEEDRAIVLPAPGQYLFNGHFPWAVCPDFPSRICSRVWSEHLFARLEKCNL